MTQEPYAYAHNSPLTFVDPLGLAPWDWVADKADDAWDATGGRVASGVRNWSATNLNGEGIANIAGGIATAATIVGIAAAVTVATVGSGGTVLIVAGGVAAGAGVTQAVVGGRYGDEARRSEHIGRGLWNTTFALGGGLIWGVGRVAWGSAALGGVSFTSELIPWC